MKRAMTGGAHRGPVAHARQRRTIRLMQVLLVFIAAGLFMAAGYSYGHNAGYDAARADTLDQPDPPSQVETVVLAVLGVGVVGAAFWLGGPGGVRIPTPRRLEEFAGRAEGAALERAARLAERREGPDGDRPTPAAEGGVAAEPETPAERRATEPG